MLDWVLLKTASKHALSNAPRMENKQPLITQCVFYASAAAAEVPSLKRLDKGFRIKEGLTPGKLIETATPTELATSCEKNLGRLAMLVTTLFFASSIANL